MARGDRLMCALIGAVLLLGCVTDHDALQKKPSMAGSSGGAGGTLGNAHLFAGNKLSATGAHNLYLYVLSLAQGGGTPEATAAS